ncbi:hypothetical protein [Acidovorax sp. SUPP3334]|uniref:hypothetical protein n=1 Tax=Acidovorax sp. SUPP3334 TaxID=2920881 RepID=UPI0023DE3C3E|nr:hypothetical protein [Acidovorax sp. SUPP3334]GKT24113.1 hypothetical protein AVHM3334_13750 [Acidovorax sp. SUPP3334]
MTATTHARRPASASANACRLVLDIAPGQHVLVCLPAASTLQALEGDLRLGFGPLICGQVLHAARQSLVAGQTLTQGGSAAWVRLHNPGLTAARAVLTEAAPQRSALAHAWAWVAARWTRTLGENRASAESRVGAAH